MKTQLLSLFRRQSNSTPRLRRKPAVPFRRAPLALEGLETRLLPASLFVVPLNLSTDASHFHSLAAAVQSSSPNGVVTVEPGAVLETVAINVAVPGLTIQGDPNIPGSILPAYDLVLNASGVTLDNLNLHNVSITKGSNHETISHSQVQSISSAGGGLSGNGDNTITQNVITGTVSLNGNSFADTNDVVAKNTFVSQGPATLLSLSHDAKAVVKSNTMTTAFGSKGIVIQQSMNALVIDNTIRVPNGPAITVSNDQDVLLQVSIKNNNINGGAVGSNWTPPSTLSMTT